MTIAEEEVLRSAVVWRFLWLCFISHVEYTKQSSPDFFNLSSWKYGVAMRCREYTLRRFQVYILHCDNQVKITASSELNILVWR